MGYGPPVSSGEGSDEGGAARGARRLWIGPIAAAGVGLLATSTGLSSAASWTAAVTALCAVWWVSEALPIAATSLIPFALFPLVGVLSPKELAEAYGHPLILLLLGGFLLSAAMERSGAHRRIALRMIRLTGGRGGAPMVLAFMLASALLSMWISNTATTLMLLPVALAVLDQDDDQHLSRALLLGIAYAASIGGLGTPIGTPPNAVFMGVYTETVGQQMSFLEWMRIGVPASILLLPIAWFSLTRGMKPAAKLKLELSGRWQPQEKRVLWLFAITALLWMTRSAPAGGWNQLLPASVADDSTVALLASAVAFVLPDGRGQRMLDWQTAKKIPWGLLILFAGGIAIAKAFVSSGLSKDIAGLVSHAGALPTVVVMGLVCLGVTFLTEVTSNTATATLLMPILAAAAAALGWDPRLLMIPAALSASCAFMLPVATAPNAIVFGTGRFTTQDMAREGLRLNLLGALVLTLLCWVLL